jgi:hypothetical protein
MMPPLRNIRLMRAWHDPCFASGIAGAKGQFTPDLPTHDIASARA